MDLRRGYSIVCCGCADRCGTGKLCHRWCRWRGVGWRWRLAILPTSAFLLRSLALLAFRPGQANVELIPPTASVSHQFLPCFDIDVQWLEIPLANITKAQLWASLILRSLSKLSIQQVFGDSPVWHAVDVPEPVESALLEKGVLAWESHSR